VLHFIQGIVDLAPYALDGNKGREILFVSIMDKFLKKGWTRERVAAITDKFARDSTPLAKQGQENSLIDKLVARAVAEKTISLYEARIAKAFICDNARAMQNVLDLVEGLQCYADATKHAHDHGSPGPMPRPPSPTITHDEERLLDDDEACLLEDAQRLEDIPQSQSQFGPSQAASTPKPSLSALYKRQKTDSATSAAASKIMKRI